MKFKKEWTEAEHKAVINALSKWERSNLTITHGNRERTVEDTYGLPYTSSSGCAMLSNTNVLAKLNGNYDDIFYFDWLGLTEDNEVVAWFTNVDEEEKSITIGTI